MERHRIDEENPSKVANKGDGEEDGRGWKSGFQKARDNKVDDGNNDDEDIAEEDDGDGAWEDEDDYNEQKEDEYVDTVKEKLDDMHLD